MKTTSTASALALSGMLLGLPMVEGRGGRPKIVQTGGSLTFHTPPTPPTVSAVGPVAGMAPPNTGNQGKDLTQSTTTGFNSLLANGSSSMTKSEEEPEKPFAAPEKDEAPVDEIRGGGTVGGSSRESVLAGPSTGPSRGGGTVGGISKADVLGQSNPPEEDSAVRAGGFPGFDLSNGDDGPGNAGDNPGNGGDPPGNGGNPDTGDNPGNGGDPDAGGDETDPDDQTIPFYCNLQIDFFEDKGKAPTPEEVKELISMTDNWLSEVMEIDPTFVYIQDEQTNTVYDPEEPDYFYVEFSSVAHANHAESDFWQLNIDDISAMIDHADYELYITHFIWEGEPKEDFQFYETQQVTLGCWRGERTTATERRRLRGNAIEKPSFGGSHKVVRH